jgi:hypothetical protein
MADMITIKNFYPHRFALDPDDESGELQTIALRIARFTVEQGKAFNRDWARVMDPPAARAIYRKPEGDEQAKVTRLRAGTDIEVFVVPDDEVRRRRVQEMTPDVRAVFVEQEQADAGFEYDYLIRLVSEHFSVDPSQCVRFEVTAGETMDVRSGADLVRMFGGHRAQLLRLGMAIWAENNLSAQAKKNWRSLFSSTPSSTGPGKVLPGPRPVETAVPAALEGSAASAAATGSNDPIPSGLAAPTSP